MVEHRSLENELLYWRLPEASNEAVADDEASNETVADDEAPNEHVVIPVEPKSGQRSWHSVFPSTSMHLHL